LVLFRLTFPTNDALRSDQGSVRRSGAGDQSYTVI